eukprot:m51a1_g4565 putative nipped-b-like protein (1403) ;mRNA; f:124915-130119
MSTLSLTPVRQLAHPRITVVIKRKLPATSDATPATLVPAPEAARLCALLDALDARAAPEESKENECPQSSLSASASAVGEVHSEVLRLRESALLKCAPLKRLAASLRVVMKTTSAAPERAKLEAAAAVLAAMGARGVPRQSFPSEALDEALEVLKAAFKRFDTGSLLTLVCECLEYLRDIAARHTLSHGPVLSVAAMCVPCFFCEADEALQMSALRLMRTVFERSPDARMPLVEDILANIGDMTKQQRTQRSYRLLDEGRSVHCVTALLLLYLQSCTSAAPEINMAAPSSERPSGAYDSAVALAKAVCVALVDRCCAGKGGEGAAPQRFVTETLLEDLLALLHLPEWPAAELLLHVLVSTFATSMAAKKDKDSRCLALDVIGVVAARIKTDLHDMAKRRAFTLPPAPRTGETPEDAPPEGLPICTCGGYADERPVVQCEDCLRWFHAECVHYAEEPQYDATLCRAVYSCADCITVCGVRRQWSALRASVPSSSPPRPSLTSVQRQLLVNYLTERARVDATAAHCARAFLESMWYAVDCAASDEKVSWAGEGGPTLPREQTARICRDLSSRRPLVASFDGQLCQILRTLADPQITVRAKAMKALTLVVESDPSILADDKVKGAVHARLVDQSISVREHTVDLVGRYVLADVALVPQYLCVLADRIKDAGVLVRKRVIKIFGELCATLPAGSPLVSDICRSLVSRVHDEPVREPVLRTVTQLWFSPAPSREALRQRAAQIVDVVEASPEADWIPPLVRRAREDGAGAVLASLVRALVDLAMATEEQVPLPSAPAQQQRHQGHQGQQQQQAEPRPSTPSQHDEAERLKSRLAACLGALRLFSVAAPELLQPHVWTLVPFLQPGDSAPVVCNVTAIASAALVGEAAATADPAAVARLEADLVRLVSTKGMQVVRSCAQCLCAVALRVSRSPAVVDKLFSSLFAALTNARKSAGPMTTGAKVALMRSIYTLGTLCGFYNFDARQQARPAPAASASASVKELLLFYASGADVDVRMKALQALCECFFQWPRVALDEAVIARFGEALAPGAPVMLRMGTAAALASVLEIEGCDVLDVAAAARAAEAGAPICQANLPHVLAMCMDRDSRVRNSAATLLGLVVRRRLVNPLYCVSALMALENDPVGTIGDKAYRVLVCIDEKFSTFISSRLHEGVAKTFELLRTSLGREDPRGVAWSEQTHTVRPMFGRLYGLLSTATARAGLVNALVAPLAEAAEESETAAPANTAMLFFVAEAVAFLPYATHDEVSALVHAVNRTTLVASGSVLPRLKSAVKEGKADQRVLNAANAVALLLLAKRFVRQLYGRCEKSAGESGSASSTRSLQTCIDLVPFAKDPCFFVDLVTASKDLRTLYDYIKSLVKEDDADAACAGIKPSSRSTASKVADSDADFTD